MPIIKLQPAYKDYIWGGVKLITDFNKVHPLGRLAESWELSAHPDGCCSIAIGEYRGISFAEYIAQNPGCIGTKQKEDDFPILIKLIDAKKALSVQVHPDNRYALRHENEHGKTEMWIVLDCETSAFIYFGFNNEISKDEFERRIKDNSLTEILKKVYVQKGDVFYIPAGTIHAIGEGIVIAEIQQNSNATYRVFDYGRKDAEGNPRQLHIQKALDVTNLNEIESAVPGAGEEVSNEGCIRRMLTKNHIFSAEMIHVKKGEYIRQITSASFLSILCIEGGGIIKDTVNSHIAIKGDSFFIPAGDYPIAINGEGSFILTSI